MTDRHGRDDRTRDETCEPEERREDGTEGGIEVTHEDDAEPLGDLAATVAERSDADRADADEPGFDDLFDRQDAADIDTDRLWERLEGDDANDSDAVIRPAERTVREVEKRAYCQDCDHFAGPPETACTREGTDILSVPTVATFRVADCPVVREDESLEDAY
ncbi:hypothetical protein [Natrinema marinum]|uniref:hypothetical protein n=1 Tax=Natrinema marinum TaxID=2961598 RepID=UPI0020C8B09C|nr:hypothetical protein [Natrinema marinum]